jgi:hypothetical protein
VLNADAIDRGAHEITIRAIDASGNTGEESYQFDVSGTSFNYGFALLFGGVAAGLIIITVVAMRGRRRRGAAPATRVNDMTGGLPDGPRAAVTNNGGLAVLVLADGSTRGIGDGITIGRGADCDVVLEGDGRSVSREHARIECVNDGCRVVDLSSINGTRVNGRVVEESWLEEGDIIEIGSARMRFSTRASAAADAAATNGAAVDDRAPAGAPAEKQAPAGGRRRL